MRTDSAMAIKTKSIYVSILTNLCFTNPIAVACLLRFTKSKNLLSHIADHRILSCKMAIAMAWFDGSMFESELMINLKHVFEVEYLVGLMRCKDQRLLRHTLEWLNVGFERDEHSKLIMQQFDFKEAIEGVLTVGNNNIFLNFRLTPCFCSSPTTWKIVPKTLSS